MNIGDRVRLIRSSEEGVITRILDNKIVEVEIEDGFQIPIKMSEVAVISSEEDRLFGKLKKAQNPIENSTEPKVVANKGIYLAFVAINDQKYALHLINNTDFDISFTFGEEANQKYQGLINGILKTRNSLKVKEVNISFFDNWGIMVFQFLFFMNGFQPWREPMVKRVRFRANTFFKNKGTAPILNKEAYLFQIDQDEKIEIADTASTPLIDPVELKEKMLEKKTETVQNQPIKINIPPKEVDLHIETLTKEYDLMNSGEMLQLQIDTFEKHFENAIATGMHEIIFIHGIGNGKLRQEIQRRLSGHPNVKFFQDAKKEKFGYGATLVALK
jgi:hypothetical protein